MGEMNQFVCGSGVIICQKQFSTSLSSEVKFVVLL